MAIDIKKYVDISTTFPSAEVAGRSFGGLVFTAKEMKETAPERILAKYNAGDVVQLSLAEVEVCFGGKVEESVDEEIVVTYLSDEYRFAEGYYSYISPSGRFASKLAFAKYLTTYKDPTDAFEQINAKTNLFGSFTFLSVPGGGGSSDDSQQPSQSSLEDVAKAVDELDTKYLFVVNRVKFDAEDAEAVCDDSDKFRVKNYGGTHFLTGQTDASAYMPMAILGSTDYQNGQVVNFMFKQFTTEEPTVIDDDTYDKYNEHRVNFYGRTQTNGQTLDFYQRGFNTDGTDTAIYCNEMWFKSACETALVNLLISRERISADALGVDLVKLEVVDVCADAIRNGMFMPKVPNAKDMRGIREIVVSSGGEETDVGSIEADVSTKGYSVYAYLADNVPETPAGEKAVVYYVFYGTADSVRFIKGNDLLLK